ncbi:hypothetical protein EG68_09810 [Paragonimus skrjabini miyazakii]|uniref:Uncharacterized protein n=1 Tax=Paragonimus skrjabini miyazakii TaxID=59628 RepID=A0A8S9YCN6_9TREM|nr:hypothetical protein EG68_09810 [Paragonimus skrjabini miyazakii]
MDFLNIDFIPAKLYVPCSSSFKNFLDSELRSLESAIDSLIQESEYTKLLDCLFIRFNNQLRHIRFFKSFCSFRRSVRHVRFGVPTKGICRFHMLLKSVDRKSTCPSLHSFDHVLVCLLQLHRLTKLSIARSFSCWKVCDLQFVTGHFTKVLLLIMTLLAGLR